VTVDKGQIIGTQQGYLFGGQPAEQRQWHDPFVPRLASTLGRQLFHQIIHIRWTQRVT
jgi:hypothetical protein